MYDVIVIGAGHAGIEACLASSRMNKKTAIVTLSKDMIGSMPCNPSVGGPAKGIVDLTEAEPATPAGAGSEKGNARTDPASLCNAAKRSRRACSLCSGTGEHQDKNGAETAGVAGFAAVAAAIRSRSAGGGRLCRIGTAGTASSPAVLSGRETEIRCTGTAVLSEHGRQPCSTVAGRGSVSGLRLAGASASGRADAADRFGTAISACQKTAGSCFAGDAEPEEPVRETAGSLCTAANAETAVVAAA